LYLCFLVVLLDFSFWRCSERNDTAPEKEQFIGKWEIREAMYDGELQPEWRGTSLIFKQLTDSTGTFIAPDTPHDSIWNSGYWSKGDQQFLVRDDNVTVHYEVRERKLFLGMFLPFGPAPASCTDGPCLPDVPGDWTFELMKYGD
jgi:hypothetical protein